MKIAVIADTHGKFPDSVASQLREADEIWHLGDFCNLATLNAVKGVGRPFYGVLGNNDWGLDLPPRLVLERGGKSFFLIHIPPTKPGGADFLLHGHTHVPRDEMLGGTRVLNPGTVGKPNKGAPPAWAWLTVDDGRVEWRSVPMED
jgi:putative phosphoesterase